MGTEEHRQRSLGDSDEDRPEVICRVECWKMTRLIAALLVLLLGGSASAQWLGYPAKNIPRNADGTPNLSAPAPRTPDGRVDLSGVRSEEHTSELQSQSNLVCRLLLEKKK